MAIRPEDNGLSKRCIVANIPRKGRLVSKEGYNRVVTYPKD